jgi:hypothetical protein
MSGQDIHVYPHDDLQEHITDGPGCPCNPRVEVEGHKAFATLKYKDLTNAPFPP